MIKFKNIVGRKPKFIVLDKLESTDIDEKIDFVIKNKFKRITYTEAIDIEKWAVENCVENAYKNNTEFIIKLGGKEQISDQLFDVILANINRNILIDQMSIYATRLKTGGKLLLSGFLTDDENTITDCANAQSLELTKKLNKENWLCLTFTKK